MCVIEISWGDASLYKLTNDHGVAVRVSNYGATLIGIDAADRYGTFADIVLGYDDFGGYESGTSYHGATVGRFANRIAGGSFTLIGKTYRLPVNEPAGNCLHGGSGFHAKIWETASKTENSVTFAYASSDGEDGFPGGLCVEVTYTLTADNELRIDSTAEAAEDTVCGLTNHSYFNLSGCGRNVLETLLKINSTRYTPLDKASIPVGEIANVAGTKFDFNAQRSISEAYDDNFILKNDIQEEIFEAAEAYHEPSGRTLTVYTNMPAMQLYTGTGLNETGKGGNKYNKFAGFCLETQYTPDTPNLINKFPGRFPSCVIKAGEKRHFITVFKFGVKQ
ncbi:aldose 1-epimerase [Betaproteobacteria bacterium]|nr:aldose 1-epimerase [Betaproteobacteria bacterium]